MENVGCWADKIADPCVKTLANLAQPTSLARLVCHDIDKYFDCLREAGGLDEWAKASRSTCSWSDNIDPAMVYSVDKSCSVASIFRNPRGQGVEFFDSLFQAAAIYGSPLLEAYVVCLYDVTGTFSSQVLAELVASATQNDTDRYNRNNLYNDEQYVTIEPQIQFSDTYGQKLVLKFEASKKQYEYHLVKESSSEQDGDCYYIDDPKLNMNLTSVDICDGQVDGIVDGQEIHYDDPNGRHVLYVGPTGQDTCTVEEEAGPFLEVKPPPGGRVKGVPTIELVMVNDFMLFSTWFNKNKTAVKKYNSQLIKGVRRLFNKTGIHVVRAESIIWTTEDLVKRQTGYTYDNGEEISQLTMHGKEFRDFAKTEYYPALNYDAIFLFTGHTYYTSNNTMGSYGVAKRGYMCSASGVGIVSMSDDGKSLKPLKTNIITAAHELAHSLGVKHDEAHCKCEAKNGLCIMFPWSADKVLWSQCSLDYMREVIKRDSCLYHERNISATTTMTTGQTEIGTTAVTKVETTKQTLTSTRKGRRSTTVAPSWATEKFAMFVVFLVVLFTLIVLAYMFMKEDQRMRSVEQSGPSTEIDIVETAL
ncbi:Snake venom metalloproteinase hemorrhagic factor 2 [Halotydeus destructor]|nr:Snake venom metalloproteinase hemorrhagic factor 2 [Halotydeus destructor]